MRPTLFLPVFSLFLAMSLPAAAEEFLLKDGTKIVGHMSALQADKIEVETDKAKRDALIHEATELYTKDYAYIPVHQQSLAWGVSKKVKIVQRADNQVLFYWATKQE